MKSYRNILIVASALLVPALFFSCKNKNSNEPNSQDGTPTGQYAGTVKDACGNTYNYVKIGNQYWMAENMRCNKYDTESEQNGKTIDDINNRIYDVNCSNIFYINASDKNNWKVTLGEQAIKNNDSKTTAEIIGSDNIPKLGYLYSWGAAVGYTTNKEAEVTLSTHNGRHQGICPNGWHIPTSNEFHILDTFIYSEGFTSESLRSTSGWVQGCQSKVPYLFSALPSGVLMDYYCIDYHHFMSDYIDGNRQRSDFDIKNVKKEEEQENPELYFGHKIERVGEYIYFWTDTPESYYSDIALFEYITAFIYEGGYNEKTFGCAVRCIKN